VQKAVDEFQAIGGVGVIMDMQNGELLSLVSLPDFDPHKPGKASDDARFNRATLGTYEMGSTFKSFTMAAAMDYGIATMKSRYDATEPLRIAGFTIQDAHPLHRWLAVPEIYAHSSNIGTARMALDIGTKRQKAFLDKVGMLKPLEIELPERAAPLYPSDWKEINTVTIAYGHGISVTPLHLVRGIAALTDGGVLPRLTLIKDGNKDRTEGDRIIGEQTSKNMRRLMRLVVNHGTGSKGDVPGYRVGGKTGTAEKVSNGSYEKSAKLTSFISAFPIDDPRYIVLVMIDNPKGDSSTHELATGGWIAAPVVARTIARMGPMLGIQPVANAPGDDAEKFWVDTAKPKQQAIIPAVEKSYVNAVAY
jgi:cell division protein FtsI (penicillin-binding protein 3)